MIRAAVVFAIHEMDRAAGDFAAVIQDRLVNARAIHSRPTEAGQKGGMDIHNFSGEFPGNLQKRKPAGQARPDRRGAARKNRRAEIRNVGELLRSISSQLRPAFFCALDAGNAGAR